MSSVDKAQAPHCDCTEGEWDWTDERGQPEWVCAFCYGYKTFDEMALMSASDISATVTLVN